MYLSMLIINVFDELQMAVALVGAADPSCATSSLPSYRHELWVKSNSITFARVFFDNDNDIAL